MLHLITLGAELRERGIGLKIPEQGIGTVTAEGRAMSGMLSVLAGFQHELIVAKGRRRSKLSSDQIELAQRLYDAGDHTVAQIVGMLNGPSQAGPEAPQPRRPLVDVRGPAECIRAIAAAQVSRAATIATASKSGSGAQAATSVFCG